MKAGVERRRRRAWGCDLADGRGGLRNGIQREFGPREELARRGVLGHPEPCQTSLRKGVRDPEWGMGRG